MQKFNNFDISKPEILIEVMIPHINNKIPAVKTCVTSIENLFHIILEAEKEILTKKLTTENINKHNRQIDKYAYEIDKNIYGLLNLSNQEIDAVESFLRQNRIHLP